MIEFFGLLVDGADAVQHGNGLKLGLVMIGLLIAGLGWLFRYLSKQNRIHTDILDLHKDSQQNQEKLTLAITQLGKNMEYMGRAIGSLVEKDNRINRLQAERLASLFLGVFRHEIEDFFFRNLENGHPEERQESYESFFERTKQMGREILQGYEYKGLELSEFCNQLDEELEMIRAYLERRAQGSDRREVPHFLKRRFDVLRSNFILFIEGKISAGEEIE